MSIKFIEEHTQKMPKDTPLRIKFEAALEEISELRMKLKELRELNQVSTSKKKGSSKNPEPPTAA